MNIKKINAADQKIIEMSLEAHEHFAAKVKKADSLQNLVNSLEHRIEALQEQFKREEKSFVSLLIESDKIRADLERARYEMLTEKQDLERRLKLLKYTHKQRRELLRKYYPKLTRDQRFSLLFVALFGGTAGLIISLMN